MTKHDLMEWTVTAIVFVAVLAAQPFCVLVLGYWWARDKGRARKQP